MTRGLRRGKLQTDGLFGNEVHFSTPRSQIFVPGDQSTGDVRKWQLKIRGAFPDFERRWMSGRVWTCPETPGSMQPEASAFSREKSVHLNTNGN